MKVRLISGDRDLYGLCREALAEFSGREWDFATARCGEPESDLTIWDYQPGAPIPVSLSFREEQRNIFLVHGKHLQELRDRLPLAAVGTLLKPVNRATLRAFLEHAVARYQAHLAPDGPSVGPAPVRDRDAMLQCLLDANLRLQEYDQQRTNFLARAVHDFRTPLTAVHGYCGLLLGQQLGPLTLDQSQVLQRMQHSIHRLSRMATALFQLSVGRWVERPPRLEPGDIKACIDQAVHEIMPLTQEKHIQITVQLKYRPKPLLFEPQLIEQVLVNLLDNACKFTPKNGSIAIRGYPCFWERRSPRIRAADAMVNRRSIAVRDPNAFRVDLQDSGPGIPLERIQDIFEEYTSYSGGQDRSGGGLGLAICRMIVRQHGGLVWAESGSQGATFCFVLPYGAAEGAAAPAVENARTRETAPATAGW